MGISRDSLHKRRLTGGKKPKFHMKRKFEMGRQMAMTKIGAKRIHTVRCRGGNLKHRALRLDTGNFSWGSEVCTRKTRILDVVYNASNNELVRTKTLVRGAVVQIDATYAVCPGPCRHVSPCALPLGTETWSSRSVVSAVVLPAQSRSDEGLVAAWEEQRLSL